MKNKKIITGVALSVLILGTSVYADKGEPGGPNDPIVSKSYVDAKISELSNELTVLIGQLQESKPEPQQTTYELVTVPQGSTIVGAAGTEVIVRSGSGQVVAGAGGGIQDLTDGVDALGGDAAKKYHLLLIPREDGRGILATSELIVMVRGGYTIQ